MPTDTTLPLDVLRAPVAPPVWTRLVVGVSILAIGATAGLAAMVHLDVKPWLAAVIGASISVSLFGIDQVFQRPPRAKPAPTRKRKPAVLDKAAPPRPTAPSMPPSAPTFEEPKLSAGPRVRPDEGPSRPLAEAAFDQQVEQLQALVREMADTTPGPKARTPDPDGLSRFVPPPRPDGQPAPAEPSASDAHPRSPSPTIEDTPQSRRIAEAVAAERMDVMLETIQGLADGRTRHFEVSVRFRDSDGLGIEPSTLADLARRAGLSARVDALKLPRVARVARRVQQRGSQPADVLAGVSGLSLADHAFMEAFVDTMAGGSPPPLVLSFSQADVRDFARVHWSALGALAEMGVRFALADVTDVDMDIDLLRARGFAFVKLDAAVFLEGLPHGAGLVPARDICRHFESAGIALVVSHVDAEAQLAAIRAHGVQFAQGSVFGGPRKVRADIVAEAA